MKIFFLLFVSIIITSCSQISFIKLTHGSESSWNEVNVKNVPSVVIGAFNEKYKNCSVVRCYQISKNKFILRFMCNEISSLAVFSSAGEVFDERINEEDEYYFDEDDFEYWDYDNYD